MPLSVPSRRSAALRGEVESAHSRVGHAAILRQSIFICLYFGDSRADLLTIDHHSLGHRSLPLPITNTQKTSNKAQIKQIKTTQNRSEEHTSETKTLMRIQYASF